jgi:hypothetical protein
MNLFDEQVFSRIHYGRYLDLLRYTPGDVEVVELLTFHVR